MSGPELHVQIDPQICQGTGYCARIAPEVFEVQGRVGVVLEPRPDPEHEGLMEEAATLCPTRAISY